MANIWKPQTGLEDIRAFPHSRAKCCFVSDMCPCRRGNYVSIKRFQKTLTAPFLCLTKENREALKNKAFSHLFRDIQNKNLFQGPNFWFRSFSIPKAWRDPAGRIMKDTDSNLAHKKKKKTCNFAQISYSGGFIFLISEIGLVTCSFPYWMIGRII